MGLNKVSVCDDGTSARSHANLFGSSNVMFKAGLNIMNMKTKSFRLQQIFLQSEVQIHSSVNNSFIATGNVACDSNWHPKAAITLSALETDQDYYHEIKKNEKKENEQRNGAGDIFCNGSNPHVWLFAGWMQSKKQSYFHLKCSSAQTQTTSLLLKT